MPTAWHEQAEWEASAAYAEGFAAGLAAYDRDLVQALTRALGGPSCTDRREAVSIHQRAADQKRRREGADADRTAVAQRYDDPNWPPVTVPGQAVAGGQASG